jgi:hypothetical protein
MILALGVIFFGLGVATLVSPRVAAALLAYNRRQTARSGALAGPGARTPLTIKLAGVAATIVGAAFLAAGIASL